MGGAAELDIPMVSGGKFNQLIEYHLRDDQADIVCLDLGCMASKLF